MEQPIQLASDQPRVLVTGGAGFIGANLVPMLVARGYYVRVYDSLVAAYHHDLTGANADLVKADVGDRTELTSALQDIDVVIHLAAAGSVVDSVTEPELNFKSNVVGTFTVLDEARRVGIDRVVLASTGGALIGDATPPVSEISLPKPISPYGASKLAGEAYAHAFAVAYGMRTVALRFANVYGPYSCHKRGAVTSFFKAINAGAPMIIYGDGKSSRDYIHVNDVCAALVRALVADPPAGSVIHVASGIETTIAELARSCGTAAGAIGHPVEYRASRPGEVARNFAGYALAHELLGFSPAVQLSDGLVDTWEWYSKYVFTSDRARIAPLEPRDSHPLPRPDATSPAKPKSVDR